MNKESLVKKQIDYQAVGEQISHELAGKMVKDFNDANSLDQPNCCAIGKDIILKTLSQPGCVGLRFYDAVNEFGKKTLVYVGIDSKGKNIVEYSTINEHGDIAVVEGMANDKGLTDHPLNWFS
jgi:hypothetical protein